MWEKEKMVLTCTYSFPTIFYCVSIFDVSWTNSFLMIYWIPNDGNHEHVNSLGYASVTVTFFFNKYLENFERIKFVCLQTVLWIYQIVWLGGSSWDYGIPRPNDVFNFYPFNPLPQNKFLDMTRFKACTDDKWNIAKMTILGVENTVGKGENAGYHHFLLFPQCFPKPSLTLGSLKVEIVWSQRVQLAWQETS